MTGWRKSSHSYAEGNCAEVASWRTATASESNACVEVGSGVTVRVRDSADRGGPVLTFAPEAWRAFTADLKAA